MSYQTDAMLALAHGGEPNTLPADQEGRRSAKVVGAANRPRTVHRFVGVAVLVSVAPALVGGLWGWLCAHPPRLVPPPHRHPDRWGVTYQEVTLRTSDGLRLAAWYTPPRNGAIILVGHGYAAARLAEVHALFVRNGYGALSWDFRAHGQSEGTHCTIGYHETADVEAALDYALAEPDVRAVGLWGGSMGGIAGLRAAERRPEIRALVLDSVPPSLEDAFRFSVRPGILRPFVRYVAEQEAGLGMVHIRPVDRIARVGPRPMLVIQGTADRMIPPDSAERLCDAAGESCTQWIVLNAGHLAAHRWRPAEYEQRVIGFFDSVLQVRATGDATPKRSPTAGLGRTTDK